MNDTFNPYEEEQLDHPEMRDEGMSDADMAEAKAMAGVVKEGSEEQLERRILSGDKVLAKEALKEMKLQLSQKEQRIAELESQIAIGDVNNEVSGEIEAVQGEEEFTEPVDDVEEGEEELNISLLSKDNCQRLLKYFIDFEHVKDEVVGDNLLETGFEDPRDVLKAIISTEEGESLAYVGDPTDQYKSAIGLLKCLEKDDFVKFAVGEDGKVYEISELVFMEDDNVNDEFEGGENENDNEEIDTSRLTKEVCAKLRSNMEDIQEMGMVAYQEILEDTGLVDPRDVLKAILRTKEGEDLAYVGDPTEQYKSALAMLDMMEEDSTKKFFVRKNQIYVTDQDQLLSLEEKD